MNVTNSRLYFIDVQLCLGNNDSHDVERYSKFLDYSTDLYK